MANLRMEDWSVKGNLPKTKLLEELADGLVSALDREFEGDGCSFFLREEGSEGRFRLVATSKPEKIRFIGVETIDAYDRRSLSRLGRDDLLTGNKLAELAAFGITKYAIRWAIRCGKSHIARNVESDLLWSANVDKDLKLRDKKSQNMYSELPASEVLSVMVVPLLKRASKSPPFDPFGLVRIVLAKNAPNGTMKTNFEQKELTRISRRLKQIAPDLETAVSISSLATLGDAAIKTETFWEEVIKRLSAIVAGTGASVFELDENRDKKSALRYVCRVSTGLYDRKGKQIPSEKILQGKIYYEQEPGGQTKSLTTWVARYKRNVVIRKTSDANAYNEYRGLIRDPGQGRYSEHPDDISVIMIPVMSIDKTKVDAIIRIAKERKGNEDGFSDEQVKLFLATIPAVSRIFTTSRRLRLLESLSVRPGGEEGIGELYKKVVHMVPKLIGAPGCTLLIAEDDELYGEASSVPHIQEDIEKGLFEPYPFGFGYTGYVASSKSPVKFNTREEAGVKYSKAKWSIRKYQCEVGKRIKTCERFLAVPILSYSDDRVIGVIRTAKMLYHDRFTDLDERLLQVFAMRLSSAIEVFQRRSRDYLERKTQITGTFSPYLVPPEKVGCSRA